MHDYLLPLHMIYALFPLIAVFFFIPYGIYQRRKYGRFIMARALIMYSFILYLICMYLYIITPLPSFETVLANPLPVTIQLHPLAFLHDFREQAYWIRTGIGTVNISHSAWFQVGGNLGLLLPFGIYLRHYFHRTLKQTLVMSFLLSLFFELTQLSALYGIYPAPYRVFDVNDLMFNTIGGGMGYCIFPRLNRYFPAFS